MDKEKIITIVLGLIVGIVLAAAYFFGSKFLPGLLNRSKSTAATTKRAPSPAPTIKTNSTKTISLEISSPDDNTSTTDKSIKVSGSFNPATTIILFANADENVATSDAQGKFNFNVALEGGENEITVSSFDKVGKLVSVKRNITMEVSE